MLLNIKPFGAFVWIVLWVAACKNGDKNPLDKESDLYKRVTTDTYQHEYNQQGLLISSLKKNNTVYYFRTVGEYRQDTADELIVYSYDDQGKKRREEHINPKNQSIEKIKLFKGLHDVETYYLSGTDTTDFMTIRQNEKEDTLIVEEKRDGLKNPFGDIPPSHSKRITTYNAAKQIETLTEYDFVKNTVEEVFYKYHHQGDTLVGKSYDKNGNLLYTRHYYTCDTLIQERIYNAQNEWSEETNQYLTNGKMTLKVVHHFEHNVLDSFFYNEDEKEIKNITVFRDEAHYTFVKTYNEKGDLIEEVEIALFNLPDYKVF